MTTEKLLFALLRDAVCGAALTEEEKAAMTPAQMEPVLHLAKRHDLAHLAGHTLKKYKLLGSDPISVQLDRQTMQAMYRYMQQQQEYTLVLQTLQRHSIAHMPLKGSVLRSSYPQPWMRTSCDIDILVQEKDLLAAADILETQLQYTRGKLGNHDISLTSPIDTNLELHYDTIDERKESANCRDVLAGVWAASAPVEAGSFCYGMSDPMFYFYHIAHMAKHFEAGGCGIRPFLDLWILNHRIPHCRGDRLALLQEGGLETFCTAMEALTEVWFGCREPDELSVQLSRFLLDGGNFGNTQNFTVVGRSKTGSTRRYWFQRIFMPYRDLKASYPVLEKHKWLVPVFQVVRWVRILRRSGVRRVKAELHATTAAEASAAATSALWEQLGLK